MVSVSQPRVTIIRNPSLTVRHHKGALRTGSRPFVSVLMSVCNAEPYLSAAMQSVLNQDYADFEFIIVADPCSDNSLNVVSSFSDSRINLLLNTYNYGLARSLNRGLETARGKYVIRMDADDISLPTRFSRQIAFMESNPEIGLSGCFLEIIGSGGGWVRFLPVDHETLHSHLIFGPLLAHPTVIMRLELLKRYNLFYNPKFTYAEDYELWTRCARCFRLANLNEVLYQYRQHEMQNSRVNTMEQERFITYVMQVELERMGVDYTPEDITLHLNIETGRIGSDEAFAQQVRQWFDRLREANHRSRYYPEPAFSIMLANKYKL